MKKRALISVSDKTGAAELAKQLSRLGYEIISTGGTLAALQKEGVSVISVSDITGFKECLDGRVKTLHPKVHAGLLALRDNKEHMAALNELDINTIDVVAVNLYPFGHTIKKEGVSFEEVVENIDIGGPSMVRSAAKNYQSVLILTDPRDYSEAVERLKNNSDDEKFRLTLMFKAYSHTAAYDSLISNYLAKKLEIEFPDEITLSYKKAYELRYGENPHQKAAFYSENNGFGMSGAQQLQGKELSFLNLADLNAAAELVKEFNEPAAVAVKHAIPCGVALGGDILKAYLKAYECDPVSIYGGIVTLNRPVDESLAKELVKIFLEVVAAPGFSDQALEVFKQKPNLRIMRLDSLDKANAPYLDFKRVAGGLLVQETDNILTGSGFKAATKTDYDKDTEKELEFALKVVKHTKSNAIVIAKDFAAIGIAGGQTNRIWAANQAIERAGERVKGAVCASDAYFPFSDCADALCKAGVKAIIQPGGSIRDAESIEVCNKYGVPMAFCGNRHFKH